MRSAGLVVWEAHHAAAQLVQPGVTTAQIDAVMEEVFDRHQAIPLFKGYPGHKSPFPAVACISVNEEIVHGIPGTRELVEGDVVSIDTGCKLAGWCGDAAVTRPVGQIDAEVQRLLDITEGTLRLAIDRLAKDQWWSEIAEQMAQYVREAGFAVVEDFVGHGIGRQMHESPQVPNFSSPQFKASADFRIEPGLVLAIEPMVNIGTHKVKVLGDHWTQVTEDGRPSAHFEHTVAITDNGPVILTAGPDQNSESWAI